MVTVGEFCNRQVATIRKTDTIPEAARRMREQHVGCLVVVEEADGNVMPTGLVTDRDIVVGALATASEHLHSLQIGDIVTEPPITAREAEGMPDALKKMRAHGIRRMPVVNDQGALQGIVAFDDLLEFLSEELADLAVLLTRERRKESEKRV